MIPGDHGNLRKKVLASAAWSTVAFLTHVAVRFGSTIVLTRLLAPEVFGVFAVVMSVIYIMSMLSDLGVRSLILTYEHELDESFLRSCWTAQVLRGLLLGLVVAGTGAVIGWLQSVHAFPADSSYASPALPLAIAAMAGSSILSGFQSPAKFLYEKRMEFRTVTYSTLIAGAINAIAVICLALVLRNVWALVIGTLIGSAATLALSFYMFRGPAMRLEWDRKHVSAIVSRGKWIMSHSAQTAFIKMADRILLGLAMPASQFGFYFIGRQIIDLIEAFLEKTHAQMGLQVFTSLQKKFDRRGFIARYYRYRLAFDGIAMTASGILLTLSPLLVRIIYPDEYQPIAGMVQILALGLPFTGPGLIRAAFSAQRRFRSMAVLSFVRLVTIWVSLTLAIIVFESVTAALLVVALHRAPEIALLLRMGWREGLVSPIREVRLLPLLAVGAGIGWMLEQLWIVAVT